MYRHSRDPAEVVAVTYCEHCRGEIYEGDEVVRINGTFGDGFVHNGWQTVCAAEYAKERVYDAEGTVSKRGIIE